jgi:RNA recognition motif. (a.k.a. RRM, RBD, or RNP domain)
MSKKYTEKITADKIPKDVPQGKVLEAFSSYGHVKRMEFGYDHQKNEPKGTTSVTFAQNKDHKQCLKSKEMTFGEQKVQLKKEKVYYGQSTSKQWKK